MMNRYNNNRDREYTLHRNERNLLLTMRQVNKIYNIIGDTDTKYLDFLREINNYYLDIVDLLKESDKYQGRVNDRDRQNSHTNSEY